ncbi:MAG: RNA methyltransferase [Proteobacteria bacterium]|nr:RNA methyltransferase [Pseudomonadota bacterium]
MNGATVANRVRIVLVETRHPGNIGSAARAMKTIGFHDLVLVAPRLPDHADAVALAAGAADVLAAARICATLEEAVADCGFVAGCTARSRHVVLPGLEPRGAATQLLDEAVAAPVALVFGTERTGLTNEDLQRCHAAVHIPANPEYGSLNLAAAVQVLCYELRLAWLARTADAAEARGGDPHGDEPRATQAQMESFFAHLGLTLDAIEFHKGRSPETIMRRLRGLFLRARLDARELRILHGICSDAQRMARLAGRGGE